MGRPAHFEIHATNPEAVQAFYQTVFGWGFHKWGDNDYWLIRTGDNPDLPFDQADMSPGIDGGMLPRRGSQPEDGQAVNAWVITIAVDSAQETVDKAVAAGGTVAVPIDTVPGIGVLAYLKDPDGNLFGILEPVMPGEQS